MFYKISSGNHIEDLVEEKLCVGEKKKKPNNIKEFLDSINLSWHNTLYTMSHTTQRGAKSNTAEFGG